MYILNRRRGFPFSLCQKEEGLVGVKDLRIRTWNWECRIGLWSFTKFNVFIYIHTLFLFTTIASGRKEEGHGESRRRRMVMLVVVVVVG
jgi:hypothetical protein